MAQLRVVLAPLRVALAQLRVDLAQLRVDLALLGVALALLAVTLLLVSAGWAHQSANLPEFCAVRVERAALSSSGAQTRERIPLLC